MVVVRWLDLAVIPIALAVFLAAGLPLEAWAAVSAIWVVQRLVGVLVERRADRSDDVKTVAGLMVASSLSRGIAVVLTIFAVGVGDRGRGLAAALLFLVLFSVYFPAHLLTRGAPR